MGAGIGGGLTFVSGSVLAVRVAQRNPDRSAFMLGLFYAGPGLGILLSGIAVPATLYRSGPESWATAWAALAILSVPLAIGLLAARGENIVASSVAREKPCYKSMLWLLTGYTVFGAGYIAYMTFMIAWVQNNGGSAGFQALFWCTIGLAAIASPWLYAAILKRFRHGNAFAILTGITAIGAALPPPPPLRASFVESRGRRTTHRFAALFPAPASLPSSPSAASQNAPMHLASPHRCAPCLLAG